MIVVCALLVSTFAFVSTDDVVDRTVVDKSITLLKEDAYVTFMPFQWNLKDDGDQLIVPLRFRTRSSRGRLLTLTAGTSEEKLFTLSASVESSAIVLQITDGSGVVLKTTERQLPGANNGLEHSMSVHFNPQAQQLKVVFGQGTVDSYEDIKGIPSFEQTPFSVSLGRYEGNTGILGCITLVGLSIGRNFDFNFMLLESSFALDGCETLCQNVDCNSGTCVDLFEDTVCDCRGTQMSGAHCDEEMRSLNVSWDQFIAYQISDRESQPTVISIDFKTLVKEGVLIHGSVFSTVGNQSLGDMKLALIYGQLRLTIADFLEINFYNVSLTSDRFHKVLLHFDYARNEVELSFDDETKNAVCTVEGDFRFGNEIYFSAGGSEVGISGCVQQIFVDYFDVIDGYYKKSEKVSTSHVLQSCEMTNEILPLESQIQSDLGENHDKEPLFEFEQKQRGPPNDVEEADIDSAAIQQKIEAEIDSAVDSKVPLLQDTFIAEQPLKKQLCDNDEATFCKNHIECVIKDSQPTCVCKKGFAGEFCQFSLLPRNCDEVRLGGNLEPGTYVVDVDGSGPLLETYVYCKDGETLVPHNMPNATLMRSSTVGDLRLRINYRLFNEEQLKSLRDASETCKQAFRYDCRAAPLGFMTNKTWLSSPGTDAFGHVESEEGCGCVNGACLPCSCDGGGITKVEGFVRDQYTPITNIYALNDPSDEQGLITLGPLQCSGSAGRSVMHTVTFRSRNEAVPLGRWQGQSISFEFRTYEKVVTLLSTNDRKFEVLLDGRHLRLFMDEVNVTLTPQSRLNDGGWHKVVVEVVENAVRLSANQNSAFASLLPGSIAAVTLAELYAGGGHEGFLGCLREVSVDGKLLNMDNILHNYEGKVERGCEDRCALQDCQYDSRCVQQFDDDTVHCVCRNNITHSGPHCENSINKGTEVSLHDLKRGFLKIKNPPVTDALTRRIVLSIKTDRREAIILYLHDHLYNFVQIHLSDYTRIILTLNFNRTVSRCEVTARVGQEFSRMQWLQIMLFQREDRVLLNVNDEVCEIPKPRVLSEEFINQFEFDSDMDEVVEPPVSPLKTGTDKLPFALLFVGGIPTENYKGTLDPTYKSSVPSLLGCVRGLMLGSELIDMQNNANWPYYPAEKGAVKVGCETGCEEVEPTCKNDGHCTFKWMNTDPFATLPTCDCSKTSYYGEYCDQDSGATFAGKSVLMFNSGEILDKAIFDWSKIGEQSFAFAFAADVDSIRPQQLVIINFNDKRQMEVVLCKNGSLNVGIPTKNGYYVHTFAFNYSDGYRHFFQSFFGGKKLLSITIDSTKFDFPTEIAQGISLANVVSFVFGGFLDNEPHFELSVQEDANSKQNYSGCISNIDINLNVGRMHFKPIYYIENPTETFAPYVSQIGDAIVLGACSSFKIPGTLPALQNNVNPPEWDSPFVAQRYQRPLDAVATTTEEPGKQGGSSWWIIIVVIVVLLLIILIVLLILFCCKKKKSDEDPSSQSAPAKTPDPTKDGSQPQGEELKPLIPPVNEDKPLSRPTNITNNFDLPEPTQSLDRPVFNSPLQPKAAIERPVMRRAAPLAHTNETNRVSTPPYS